jgi:hypothetical protein
MTNELRDALMLTASFTVSGVALFVAGWQHRSMIRNHKKRSKNLLNTVYSLLAQLKRGDFTQEGLAVALSEYWGKHRILFADGLDYEAFRLLDSLCVKFTNDVTWVGYLKAHSEFRDRVLKAYRLLKTEYDLKWIDDADGEV